ncbi:unnamed protein product, partial [Gongylonema pulchrum]
MQHIHLNDNSHLSYIDFDAFRSLSTLSVMHLHKSNLTGLHNLSAQIPSLQQITLYGNPLICDCNLKWLQGIVQDEERTTCMSDASGKVARKLNFTTLVLPDKCAPRIVYLSMTTSVFEDQLYALKCGALGNPMPSVQWRGPSIEYLSNGQYVTFQEISHFESGQLHCLAYSEAGFTEQAISVGVLPRLKVYLDSLNMLEITWDGDLPRVAHKLRVRFRFDGTEI